MMREKPLQYAVYKGVGGKFGAVQFNLQRPHFYRGRDKDFTGAQALDGEGRLVNDWKQREGAIFVEAASASGKNVYDWESKITMAMSVNDMGKIVHALTTTGNVDIMHDPGAKTDKAGLTSKHLKLYSKEGVMKAGCLLTLIQTTGGNTIKHTVPVAPDECIIIRQLFASAIPSSLQW